VFNELRLEMIVRSVDHHCSNLLFTVFFQNQTQFIQKREAMVVMFLA
jgi:hypothetical protein